LAAVEKRSSSASTDVRLAAGSSTFKAVSVKLAQHESRRPVRAGVNQPSSDEKSTSSSTIEFAGSPIPTSRMSIRRKGATRAVPKPGDCVSRFV